MAGTALIDQQDVTVLIEFSQSAGDDRPGFCGGLPRPAGKEDQWVGFGSSSRGRYTRYPDVGQLWGALQSQCKPEAGCDVITIPHNTNMSESGNFAIETDSDLQRQHRIQYERLIEIHQSKGNSEIY